MAGAERVLEDRSFVYKQFFGRKGAGRKIGRAGCVHSPTIPVRGRPVSPPENCFLFLSTPDIVITEQLYEWVLKVPTP